MAKLKRVPRYERPAQNAQNNRCLTRPAVPHVRLTH
jgi:hypothetical protein